MRLAHAHAASGAFGRTPFWTTRRVRGVPKSAQWADANAANGAVGGTPYRDTKRVSCAPRVGAVGARERWH
eukprot:2167004-Pyramimonas_sp.AAC.1